MPLYLQQRSQQNPVALAQSLRHLSTGLQPSLWTALEHHAQPLLLLVGEHDRKFCQINQEMAGCRPTAELIVIENCGHTIHWEDTETFVEVVRSFLTDELSLLN